jgi:hypothetical protein
MYQLLYQQVGWHFVRGYQRFGTRNMFLRNVGITVDILTACLCAYIYLFQVISCNSCIYVNNSIFAVAGPEWTAQTGVATLTTREIPCFTDGKQKEKLLCPHILNS